MLIPKYASKQAPKKGTRSYLFKFDSRNDLERARLDMKPRDQTTMDQSLNSEDLTEAHRTTDFHDPSELSGSICSESGGASRDHKRENKIPEMQGEDRMPPKELTPISGVSSTVSLPKSNETSADLPRKEVASKAKKTEEDSTLGEPPRWSKQWTACVLLSLVCFVVVNCVIAAMYFEDTGSNVIISADDCYIHDAMVASIDITLVEPSVTLSNMIEAASCAATAEEATRFEELLPQIVLRAQERFDSNKGRIIELTDEAFHISENYEGHLKGVTFACVIASSMNLDGGVGPAAYAGHILASTLDGSPARKEPDIYNLTFLLEADVMELEALSMVYIPKRYCFDFDDEMDVGIMAGGKFNEPLSSRVSLNPKTVTVGGRTRKHTAAEY
jgi:hypothetical protein